MTNPYPPPPRRAAPWALLVALDVLVSLFTLVVFGAFGGLFMLIALNGFSGREGGIILTVYAAVVLLGNVVGAALLNWLVLRGRRAPGARVSKAAVVVPAVAVTTVLLLVGPPLSVFLIKLIF
ncbi:MAG TPA: hypothetical protein VER08_06290 [Pyrinomonadaceae bacterium]|nr:hypothetical protein [Pyrinomonadaceae bacterium]